MDKDMVKNSAIQDISDTEEIDISELQKILDENPDYAKYLTSDEINALLNADEDYQKWSESIRRDPNPDDFIEIDEPDNQDHIYQKELHDISYLLQLKETADEPMQRISVALPKTLVDCLTKGKRNDKTLHDMYNVSLENRSKTIADLLRYALANPPAEKKAEQLETSLPPIKHAPIMHVDTDPPVINQPLTPNQLGMMNIETLAATFDIQIDRNTVRSLLKMDAIAMQRRLSLSTEEANRLAILIETSKRIACIHSEGAKIQSPADVADRYMPILKNLQKEVIIVVAMDTKGKSQENLIIAENPEEINFDNYQYITDKRIFEGTLNASVFHPREILKFVIDVLANAFIMLHNHPSGCPQPSQQDIRSTKQLMEAADYVGIKLLDHIIIGDGIFVSLKEDGHI